MLELLRTGGAGPRAAAETCLAALRAARAPAARWLRLAPGELRLDLAGAAAWFDAARAAREDPGSKLEARHRLDRLAREAAAACGAAEPETLLGEGLALGARRRALDPGPFAAHAAALAHELEVGSFETRDALERHLVGAALPPGRVLLRALRLETERRRALVDHASRADWLLDRWARVPADLARGSLFVPAEDLRARDAALTDLRDGRDTPATAAMLADLGLWARDHLDRAWELPGDLGPVRWRGAALALATLEARLAAFERRGYAVLGDPPVVGRVRAGVTVARALVLARPPRR